MLNLDEIRAEIYKLSALKLEEQDAEDLTDEIMRVIEENLEEAILPR